MIKMLYLFFFSLVLFVVLLFGVCFREVFIVVLVFLGKVGIVVVGKVVVVWGIIDVEGGLIVLVLLVDGLIIVVLVKEGVMVKKGQLLLLLDGVLLQQEVVMVIVDLVLVNDCLKGSQVQLCELECNVICLFMGVSEGVFLNQQVDVVKQQLVVVCVDVDVVGVQVDMVQYKLEYVKLRLQQMLLSVLEVGIVVGQVLGVGVFVQVGKLVILLLLVCLLQVCVEFSVVYVDVVQVGMKVIVVLDSDGVENMGMLLFVCVVCISLVFVQVCLFEDVGCGVVKVVECVLEFDGEVKVCFGQYVWVEFWKQFWLVVELVVQVWVGGGWDYDQQCYNKKSGNGEYLV